MNKTGNAYGLFINKSTKSLILFLSHNILRRYKFSDRKLAHLITMDSLEKPSKAKESPEASRTQCSPPGTQGYKIPPFPKETHREKAFTGPWSQKVFSP